MNDIDTAVRSAARWSSPNDYNRQDPWECFVMAHAGLLGVGSVYFTRGTDSEYWQCKHCGTRLGALAPSDNGEGDRYYYWCRCDNHGEADANEYNRHER